MGRIVVVLLVLWLVAMPQPTRAGERWKLGLRRGTEAVVPSIEVQQRAHYAQARATGIDRGPYPKFTGGFHSREMQNLGVPTGDVGLRGNGFSMFPW